LYFDPHRPEELAAGMVAVGNGTRREFVEAGYRQAAGFSWERTARATLDVIRQTVARPARAVVGPAACLPLISVVTPSLQQATYVERTIKSVLEQGYPQLEYWVIDGGSTDGTVEILERYRRRYPGVFHYVSEPDQGQADAVNKGLARVSGDIIGWLNSDDTYEPGGLAAVAHAFGEHPDCHVIYGRANHITPQDESLGPYPTADHFNWDTLVHQCFVCQPAVFWRKTVVDQGFRLDDRLQLCLDYEFWIRLGKHFTFRFLDCHLANSRVYQGNKTISRRAGVYEEAFAVVKRHFGWLPLSWALGKAHYQRGESDPFYHPHKVAPLTYLLAIVLLARHNWSGPRYWRRVGREVWHMAGTLKGSAARRLFPSRRHTVKVPALCPVVELGVEVLHTHPGLPGEIDLWWAGQRMARFDVNGPGKYSRLVSLPADPARRPARLSLRSELFRRGAARALPPRPYPIASDDGWLEQRDTLRVPPGWQAVDLAFMLPSPSAGGIRLTFRHRNQVIDQWHFDTPGTYRQRLRLPPGTWSAASHTELDFTSNASLPPEPARGETRVLAMRLLEATDASEVDADRYRSGP
jgi:glycosyltransferase involved in cell wall biosynthesis